MCIQSHGFREYPRNVFSALLKCIDLVLNFGQSKYDQLPGLQLQTKMYSSKCYSSYNHLPLGINISNIDDQRGILMKVANKETILWLSFWSMYEIFKGEIYYLFQKRCSYFKLVTLWIRIKVAYRSIHYMCDSVSSPVDAVCY